jgi:hypothetical protein
MRRENNVNDIDGDVDGDGEGYETHTLRIPEVTRLQEAYVRKVLDTLSDLGNVIYEISNESHGGSTDWQYHMIRLIKHHEHGKLPQHPVWMSYQWDGIAGPGSDADLLRSPADAVSPSRGTKDVYRSDPPPADGTRVVISDTDHLWGIGGTADWVWKSFLRGLHPIFMDPYKASPHHGENDVDPRFDGLRLAMGQTRAFADRVDLLAMAPSGPLSSTGYCLANPGREYLVYRPDGASPVRVELAGGTYRVEWFSTGTGESLPADTMTAQDGWRDFPVPFTGPAILYLASA